LEKSRKELKEPGKLDGEKSRKQKDNDEITKKKSVTSNERRSRREKEIDEKIPSRKSLRNKESNGKKTATRPLTLDLTTLKIEDCNTERANTERSLRAKTERSHRKKQRPISAHPIKKPNEISNLSSKALSESTRKSRSKAKTPRSSKRKIDESTNKDEENFQPNQQKQGISSTAETPRKLRTSRRHPVEPKKGNTVPSVKSLKSSRNKSPRLLNNIDQSSSIDKPEQVMILRKSTTPPLPIGDDCTFINNSDTVPQRKRTESAPVIVKDFVEVLSMTPISRESLDRAVPKRLMMHVKNNSEGSLRKDKPFENAVEVDIASQIAELERVIEQEENTGSGQKHMSKCFSVGHSGQVLNLNKIEKQND